MPNLRLKVCEIFTSLQGEGTMQGYLTTFIRLSDCNLACPWCDTKYHTEGIVMDRDVIIDKVKKGGARIVCITGGEPLVQAIPLVRLMAELRSEGFYVVVETNGTFEIEEGMADKWVLDYKLKSANPLFAFKGVNFMKMGEDDELKFVIANKEDYEEAKLVRATHRYEGVTLFSPLPEVRTELADWMVEDKLKGVKYSLQIHKVLWGDKRKV